jgi:hypothetical protein
VLGDAVTDLSERVTAIERRLDWTAIEALLSAVPEDSDLYTDYSV